MLQHRSKFAGQMVVYHVFDPAKNAHMQGAREEFKKLFFGFFKVPDHHYVLISRDEILSSLDPIKANKADFYKKFSDQTKAAL